MRTTLTLDDDVAKLIERLRKRRGVTFREIVNEALRGGLARLDVRPRTRRRHETKAVSLGGCLVGSIDDVAEVLVVAEGDGSR
jgi:hypothetical protein